MNARFLFLFSLIGIMAFSQTEAERDRIVATYDVAFLQQLQQQFEQEHIENKRAALEAAQTFGYLTEYDTDGYGRGELMFLLADGTPIYYETTNLGAGITARVDRINSGGSSGLNLDGNGMEVGVWDGGRVRSSHALLQGRAIQYDGNPDNNTHATHVTGTIIGTGSTVGGMAKGMAPMASTRNYDFNNDISEMTNAALDGLLVSNHSYGIPAHPSGNNQGAPNWYIGKYTQESRSWDIISYNAPYFLNVKSAGNSRNQANNNPSDGGYDLLTGSGVSKNNLVVAAVEDVYDYTGPASVIMSDFSSWGPPDDGRIKPDISAKGVNTFSSIANSDTSYTNLSGTSMSAPSVSGAIILLQEHYNNLNSDFMLSSTLRGLVIHTADEAGEHPGPDYQFGWGLINAEKAAEVISENGITSYINELDFNNASGYTITGLAVPGERLVASITWIDVPGEVSDNEVPDEDTPALVNDFDLRVVSNSNQTYFPWVLDHFNFEGAATQGDNSRDNVEKIEIDEPSGEYTVRITHKGELSGERKVSLIISGMTDVTLNTPDADLTKTSIYPNPASSILHIQSSNQISQVQIMNIMGQQMGLYQVNNNTTQLDVSSLSTGTYFVRVTIDNESKVYKFIKN